jgi:hypothetical protein
MNEDSIRLLYVDVLKHGCSVQSLIGGLELNCAAAQAHGYNTSYLQQLITDIKPYVIYGKRK